jgi:hypothetical protein
VGVLDASTSPPKERYAVPKDNVIELIQPGVFDDQLTEVLRNGARALLARAVEAEVADFLDKHADLKTADGHQRVVRHGHLPEREVTPIASTTLSYSSLTNYRSNSSGSEAGGSNASQISPSSWSSQSVHTTLTAGRWCARVDVDWTSMSLAASGESCAIRCSIVTERSVVNVVTRATSDVVKDRPFVTSAALSMSARKRVQHSHQACSLTICCT